MQTKAPSGRPQKKPRAEARGIRAKRKSLVKATLFPQRTNAPGTGTPRRGLCDVLARMGAETSTSPPRLRPIGVFGGGVGSGGGIQQSAEKRESAEDEERRRDPAEKRAAVGVREEAPKAFPEAQQKTVRLHDDRRHFSAPEPIPEFRPKQLQVRHPFAEHEPPVPDDEADDRRDETRNRKFLVQLPLSFLFFFSLSITQIKNESLHVVSP